VAFAQYPEAGSKAFAFSFSGLQGLGTSAGHTGTLLFKYYKTDDFVWRISGALSVNDNNSTSYISGKTVVSSSSGYSASLGFGFEKIITKVNRFTIYTGADLVPAFGSSSTSETATISDSTLAKGYNGDYTKNAFKIPTSLSLGLYPFIGFNYFISKNFSIGAEFGLGISYSFPSSGTEVLTQRTLGINYAPVSTPYEMRNGSFSFTSANSAVITGAVYF